MSSGPILRYCAEYGDYNGQSMYVAQKWFMNRIADRQTRLRAGGGELVHNRHRRPTSCPAVWCPWDTAFAGRRCTT
jgi:hypothetical protein